MEEANTDFILEKLSALRVELVDLAFVLETRGRLDAADVAVATAHRVDEICAELTSPGNAWGGALGSCAMRD